MKLPNWQDLPQLDLYLDQVLLYVNQVTSSAISQKEKPLTAAMINNYVKQGILPKPIKKKYGRNQVARLIILSLSKSVFQLPDIVAMIELLAQDRAANLLYDDMINCLYGQKTEETHPLIISACKTLLAYQETLALIQSLEEINHES
ncbi:DUF1836 domain-containing protein [Streptococcus gallolyticus]|uniref:DUF1836 domain-containing protein n=1 Tax=Streptococcus hepaticus TaxID=3349163 RepID=UPI001C980E14|nr:DUF1836 domain-containing protein [Streptococcus gallolyticus]MBY5041643.1 DUF1836 domain-containing protein [Streptococcus gallolyticus]